MLPTSLLIANRGEIAICVMRAAAEFCDNGQSEGTGQQIAPHGMAVTPENDILVAEVSWTILGSSLKPSRPVRNFLRLVKMKRTEHSTHV